jgi:hypothetical protein
MDETQECVLNQKLNATPKQSLFGNLWLLGSILNAAEFPEKQRALSLLFGAMSWEPLIGSDEKPNV